MTEVEVPMRRCTVVLLALCLALAVPAGAFAHPPRMGRPIALARPAPFTGISAPGSVWNRTVAPDAPLDPTSAALVARLTGMVAADQQNWRGPWIDTTKCATPIYRVPARQARVRVHLRRGRSRWARPLQRAFARVPLPSNVQPSKCSDAALALWQPATDRYWEFWKLERRRTGWHADWGGAIRHVSRNPGYFRRRDWPGANTSWGASATSLTLAGGLIKLSDLAQGHIDHALVLVLPQTRAGQWSRPAQRTDTWGGDTAADSIPAGARFRLDPSLDLSTLALPPLTRMLAAAAQRYGLIVTERTNWMVGIGAESGAPYVGTGAANPYAPYLGGLRANQILNAFPWDRLQLLRLRLRHR
jgi:hypothetical protein